MSTVFTMYTCYTCGRMTAETPYEMCQPCRRAAREWRQRGDALERRWRIFSALAHLEMLYLGIAALWTYVIIGAIAAHLLG